MPSQLAALLTLLFIAWLLIRFSRFTTPMSLGLWIPFIWITINSSRPIGYWFSTGTMAASSDITSGSAFDRNSYIILIVLGLFVLLKRNINWAELKVNLFWIFVLYLYYLLTVLWSDYPFITLKRWIKDFSNNYHNHNNVTEILNPTFK